MEWVTVYTTNNYFDAEIKVGLLSLENIQAVILNQRDSAYGTFGTIKVQVSAEDEKKSREILANGI
jgi:hypothetical protein